MARTEHLAAREAVRISCPVCGATLTQPPTRGRYRVACPGECKAEWKRRVVYLHTGSDPVLLAEFSEQRATLTKQLDRARAVAEAARIGYRIDALLRQAADLAKQRDALTTTERARP